MYCGRFVYCGASVVGINVPQFESFYTIPYFNDQIVSLDLFGQALPAFVFNIRKTKEEGGGKRREGGGQIFPDIKMEQKS